MASTKETTPVRASEEVTVTSLTDAQIRKLLQDPRVREVAEASGLGMVTLNSTPAFEEGPHLRDPEIRRAKREQLVAAGIKPDDERLTTDMRSLLRGRE